jgi:hypothetical protein
MSSHHATGTVWVGNLDSEDEADEIRELIESALGEAGYHATVSIDVHADAPLPGEGA